MKLNRKTLTNLLLLLLAAGVFILIGVRTDWASTWNSVKSANLWWILLAVVVMLLSHWIRAVRWNMLTEPAGYKLNKRRSFYSVMSGYLVNVATSRGGEVVRCALTAKSEKAPVELLLGTVLTERIVDLFMLVLVCGFTLLTQFKYISGFFEKYLFPLIESMLTLRNGIIVAVGLLLLILAFIWFKKRSRNKAKKETEETAVEGFFQRFTGGLKTVFKLKSPGLFLLYSIGIWVGYWIGGWCLLKSLKVTEHLEILNGLGLLVFSAVGIAIPLPAGAGVWGAVSIGLSTVYGLSRTDGDTFGIFNIAYSNLSLLLIGSVCYFLLWMEMQKAEKNDTR